MENTTFVLGLLPWSGYHIVPSRLENTRRVERWVLGMQWGGYNVLPSSPSEI